MAFTLPSPTQTAWDFDETAVSSWDTDVTATSVSDMHTKIRTACAAGAGYHRITCSFTSVTTAVNENTTTATPSADTYILVEPATTLEFSNKFVLGANDYSNVKWKNITFGGETVNADDYCFYAQKSDSRWAFESCTFGWTAVGHSVPTGLNPTFAAAAGGDDAVATYSNCTFDGVNIAIACGGSRKTHCKDCLFINYVDDAFRLSCGLDADCYLYAINNVVAGPLNDPAATGVHPDFIQCSGNSQTGIVFRLEIFQNCVYMNNLESVYIAQGIFVKNTAENSGVDHVYADIRNNAILVSGQRALQVGDTDCTVSGNIFSKAGHGVVADDGVGNNQFLEFSTYVDATGTATVCDSNVMDTATGLTATNVTRANWSTTLSSGDALDTIFPNLSGVGYSAAPDVYCDAYTGSLTKTAIRTYVADEYYPLGGYDALGMTSPNTWYTGYVGGTVTNSLYDDLGSAGYTGTINDRVYKWLGANGFSSGSFNDRLFKYYGSLGYTGTLRDRMKQAATANGYNSVNKFWKEMGLILSGSSEDTLLANDVESTSEVTTPTATETDEFLTMDSASSTHLTMSSWATGTGDFTMTFNCEANSGAFRMLLGLNGASATYVGITASGELEHTIGGYTTSTSTISYGEMNELIVQRVSGTITMYINGVADATTRSSSASVSYDQIGRYNAGAYYDGVMRSIELDVSGDHRLYADFADNTSTVADTISSSDATFVNYGSSYVKTFSRNEATTPDQWEATAETAIPDNTL